jgi:uncharacterized membrane protein YqjE
MPDQPTSELAQAIQEVSEKASLLVREEIELAKAEMTEKVTKLAKGAVVGVVAGVFALFGLIYLLQAFALAIWKVIDGDGTSYYLGFLIVAILLFIFGGLGAYLAARFFKGGSPPTPVMAIDEAKLIKETVTSSRPAQTSPAIRPTQEVDR